MRILQRLWDGLGFGDSDPSDYEYEYIEEVPSESAEWQTEPSSSRYTTQPSANLSSTTNVVGLPGRGIGQPEMLVMEPRSFEEIPHVVSALKQRKSVILNLGLLEADAAQRCVDFVAGGTFAVDGHQERIGETIFLFTPGFVQISSYPTEPFVEPSLASPQRLTVPMPAWSVEGVHKVQ